MTIQVLAASLLSLISIIITTLFYLCSFLSPLFNLIINSTVLIIQFVGFVLLSWNMSGTLSHSCSSANWASNDGMMVCRIYKALYSFAVFALLAQIAQIVLDTRSRHNQTKLGRYDNIQGSKDLKMDDLSKLKQQQYQQGHSQQPSQASFVSHASSDEVPYGIHDYRERQARPQQAAPAPVPQPTYQAYPGGENTSYYNPGNHQMRVDDFSSHGQAYGSGGYGYSGR